MGRKGVDSASEPSVADVQTAIHDGVSWWLLYLAGGGATHNWSSGGVSNLRAGGLNDCLPCLVPALTGDGHISPNANPEADADALVAAAHAFGIGGVCVLDTEASMRGDPWTAQYEARFGARIQTHNEIPVTYAGGFTLDNPPKYTPIWIVQSTDPPSGVCYQYGGGQEGNTAVDYDMAATGFPLATLHYNPTPPSPVTSSSYPLLPGGPMPSEVFTVPTDGTGNGWCLLDGSDARVGHLAIPWPSYVSISGQGGYPPVDGYVPGAAKPQNRNGYVCVQVTGARPNAQMNAVLVHTAPAGQAMTVEEAVRAFGDDIVTHENWQTKTPSVAFGGGSHDPDNNQGG